MKTLREYYSCSTMNMIVELTNACNLRCKYCFENCQTEQRDFYKMTRETLKKSIDFLVDNRQNCHLTFFGGEPSLCKDLIMFGMEYGNSIVREKRKYISYSIVTNGTELDDDFISVLNKNNVNIIYSFDGNEISQNKYRPFASGDGSYEIVYNNMIKILNTRKDERYGHFIIRPTVTAETIGMINNIYRELVKVGCREISFSLVSAEEDKYYAIKQSDLDYLRDAYKEMTENYYHELLEGDSFNKFFEGILHRVENNYISKEFCDCGKRYIAVDVQGNIYPCEGFIGVEGYRMGNIFNEELEALGISPRNVDENSVCKDCWAKYLCGGSCYHEAWMRTNSIDERNPLVCETYKMAFEYALKLYSKLKDKDIHVKDIMRVELLPERSVPIINQTRVKRIEVDKIYVCDGVDNRIITLNHSAQRVFELCDGINSLSDITNIIKSEYECKCDIYSDINDVINLFLENQLVNLTV